MARPQKSRGWLTAVGAVLWILMAWLLYPLINLDRRSRDLHRYLRFLEELLVVVLHRFGVVCFTVSGRTGIWTGF